jgi:N-acetylneuraminate synthase
MIKVPSACSTHHALLRLLCGEFGGKIHVSLGMTRRDEIDRIVECVGDAGRAQDLVLYHCTSGYPVRHDEVHLLEIVRLRDRYGAAVGGIGYSGHHLGIALDVAAYALGAAWFERHFTLDRTLKGTDHAASLEPDGLRRVWRDLNAAHRAMTEKPEGLLPVEEAQWKKLKWNRNQ